MRNLDLIGFFSLGLAGGFGHCMGMCHPFVLYISGRFVGERTGYGNLFKPHLAYNAGRVATYGLLGVPAGLLGGMGEAAGKMVGIQKVSAVLAGGFLIVYALLAFTGYNFFNRFENRWVNQRLKGFLGKVQPRSSLLTGVVLGLLPCGLVYGALIAASASGNPLRAAAAMVLFGAGTSVAMLLTALLGNLVMRRRGLFHFLSLVLLLGMGGYFIYNGIRF